MSGDDSDVFQIKKIQAEFVSCGCSATSPALYWKENDTFVKLIKAKELIPFLYFHLSLAQ